ncbi:hypothetical protein [Candidatus Mesenet endosymbiont of Phosphuga atrata]|uniref:hypothetical protein n=1 Tax=Candidatus Mesenet endosymbiont of Phosphuga atrata TaxID=3066221 RepID=UPI0030D0930D
MLNIGIKRYSLFLCLEDKKNGKKSFHKIDIYPIIGGLLVFVIIPFAIIIMIIASFDKVTAVMTTSAAILGIYTVFIALLLRFTCYYLSCSIKCCTKSKSAPVQVDNSIEDKDVLEELIRHDTRSSEKSVQTNMTMQKFVTESVTIEDIRDYDIPRGVWAIRDLASEEIEMYNSVRASINDLNSIASENGKHRKSKSVVSTDTGITGFTSLSSEDLLERIGPSASKSMVLENTVLEGHNINVSADVVVHSPFNSYQKSFDTDSLESQVTK